MSYKEGQIVVSKTTGWHDDYTGKDMRKTGDKLKLGMIGTWRSLFRMSATNLRNDAVGTVYPEDVRPIKKKRASKTKKKTCCDWHSGEAGHPCEVCDDPKRCAWIFGGYGEEKHIWCYEHQGHLED
jgi:hypothetical protein